MQSYDRAVETLCRLQWSGQKLGLENVRAVLARIGDPHNQFRSVHIAGTNGKGSAAVAAASILRAQGFRTGLYTSPHLLDFTERIRVNGRPISREAVVDWTDRLSRAVPPDTPVTFFEFTTAMAFAHFAESGVDWAVIETGLGGRLDATNIVVPAVSVITHIGLDHQEYLGETLEKIAGEKAGIIKPGVPVVTGVDRAEALAVIARVAAGNGSPLYTLGEAFGTEGDDPSDFAYAGIGRRWKGLSFPLMGAHQLRNAACALAACELLAEGGISLSEASVRAGLRSVRWEGRLEAVETAEGPLFLLDGAHNPAGAEALRDSLVPFMRKRGGRLILILGILRDKNIPEMLNTLAPLAGDLIVTQAQHHRAAPASQIAAHARGAGTDPHVTESVEAAVRLARNRAAPEDVVCVTGSLFTVGEARAVLKGLGVPSPLKG